MTSVSSFSKARIKLLLFPILFAKGRRNGKRNIGELLLRCGVSKVNSLCNVALKSFYRSLEESLFALVEILEWVEGLLSSVRLLPFSELVPKQRIIHTPSSIGTEKKSRPVSLAMASPPGTPER